MGAAHCQKEVSKQVDYIVSYFVSEKGITSTSEVLFVSFN